jgi:hypothetical protein
MVVLVEVLVLDNIIFTIAVSGTVGDESVDKVRQPFLSL